MAPEVSGLTLSTTAEPKVVVLVTLTSPIMRDSTDPVNGNVLAKVVMSKSPMSLLGVHIVNWGKEQFHNLTLKGLIRVTFVVFMLVPI
jgi:hypothetical protein